MHVLRSLRLPTPPPPGPCARRVRGGAACRLLLVVVAAVANGGAPPTPAGALPAGWGASAPDLQTARVFKNRQLKGPIPALAWANKFAGLKL